MDKTQKELVDASEKVTALGWEHYRAGLAELQAKRHLEDVKARVLTDRGSSVAQSKEDREVFWAQLAQDEASALAELRAAEDEAAECYARFREADQHYDLLKHTTGAAFWRELYFATANKLKA